MERYVFHVTHQCNLSCKYCYERDRKSTYTEDEILATAAEILKSKEKEYSIEFIGGEPLLAFKNIQVAYRTIKASTNKCKDFVISTNGTLITDDVLNWLHSFATDVRLSVSLDGDRYRNQLRVYKDGRGSYEKVVENLKKSLDILGSDRVSVHLVSTPFNVGYLCDSVLHIYELGIKSIGVGIIEGTIDIGEEFARRWLLEMGKLAKVASQCDLQIHEFNGLKPENDQKYYVYDEEGKMIFESYGRADNDAITNDEVNAVAVGSDRGELIKYLRRTAYEMYQDLTCVIAEIPKTYKDKCATLEETFGQIAANFPWNIEYETKEIGSNIWVCHAKLTSYCWTTSQGKGTNEMEARVSALAEMVERVGALDVNHHVYGATKDGDKILSLLRYEHLDEYVGKNVLPLPHINGHIDHHDSRLVIGNDLLTGDKVGVNIRMLKMEQGSNGTAVGNTLRESIVQATCEVFERYCQHRAVTSGKIYPTVDVPLNETILSQVQWYMDQNYEVYIKDIGEGIFPVWGVYFVNNNKEDDDMTRYSFVCASSFNSEVAIERCMTEKAQIGINYSNIHLSRDNPLWSLVSNGRTRVDMSHLSRGKLISYHKQVSGDINLDIQQIKFILRMIGANLTYVVMNEDTLPVVTVYISDMSSMDRFYDGDHIAQKLKEFNRPHWLLEDNR